MNAIEELTWRVCRKCGGSKVVHDTDCPDCQGTGLAFPQLSERCHRLGHGPNDMVGCLGSGKAVKWDTIPNHRPTEYIPCPNCGGRGRVRKPDAECLQELLRHYLFETNYVVSFVPSVEGLYSCQIQHCQYVWNAWTGEGDTVLEALVSAVLKLEEGKNES